MEIVQHMISADNPHNIKKYYDCCKYYYCLSIKIIAVIFITILFMLLGSLLIYGFSIQNQAPPESFKFWFIIPFGLLGMILSYLVIMIFLLMSMSIFELLKQLYDVDLEKMFHKTNNEICQSEYLHIILCCAYTIIMYFKAITNGVYPIYYF